MKNENNLENNEVTILSEESINNIYNMLNSNLSESEKLIRLRSACKRLSIIADSLIYYHIELKDTETIMKLLFIYKYFENKIYKVYFIKKDDIYKCTSEQIKERIVKINILNDIMNSDMSDYNKVEKFLELFNSVEEFRKSYSLFHKYGLENDKLKLGIDAIKCYKSIYAKLKEYEEQGIVSKVKYVMNKYGYYQNYEYARFIVTGYINYKDSQNLTKFLNKYGINKDIFDYCIKTIEELDVDLYKTYMEKKTINMEKRCFNNKITIHKLAIGIRTGKLPNGSEFNMIEFIKRIPFKRSDRFLFTINDFMKRNNPDDQNIIINYILQNKMQKPGYFKELNFSELYNGVTTINGEKFTNKDIKLIFEYMRLNEIPFLKKTYALIKVKYLNGKITEESIQKQKEELSKIENTEYAFIIPSLKRNN